jgi:hypothetical protein
MPKKGRQATRTTPGFTGPFKGHAQQGTLFDVRTLPKTGEEIGPRGYSVNRSRQFQDIIGKSEGVRHAVGVQEQSVGPEEVKQGVSEESGIGPSVKPEQHPFGPSSLGEIHNRPVSMGEWSRKEAQHPGYFDPIEERRKSMKRGQSKLIDTLARSTVNPEHLKNLGMISVEPPHPERAGVYFGGERGRINVHVTEESPEADSYSERPDIPFSHPERVKRPEQRGPVDPHSELTLLHEIGHHASAQRQTWHSKYKTHAERGREEGFADAYMMSRYREDPRTTRWRGATDPREHSYLARGHLDVAKFGTTGPSEYKVSLGKENVPPRKSFLNVISGGAETERHERPMLDEPLPEHEQVFTQHLKGWSYPGSSPEEHRQGIYSKAAQRTNMLRRGFPEAKAEVKRRWGVNRNLGAQWRQRDQPSPTPYHTPPGLKVPIDEPPGA